MEVIGARSEDYVRRWLQREVGLPVCARPRLGCYSGFAQDPVWFYRTVIQESILQPMSLNKEWTFKTTGAGWRWRTWRGLT